MKEIAIITGGDSAEYDISISSANVVLCNLDQEKYNATIINIKNNNWIALIENKKIKVQRKDFSVNTKTSKIRFDYVFMALHGPPAENGLLQSYFDDLNIPYSSCNGEVSALTFNKIECNKKLVKLGFRCPKSLHYKKGEKFEIEDIINTLGLPCFIKPNQAGSSFGITKVRKKEDIPAAINKALLHDDMVLLEEFIEGIELSCGVRRYNNKATAFPITEIISENDFFDFDAKYKGLSEEITPARISKSLSQKIQKITQNVFDKMNLRGVCRVDFILMKNNPYIIEINTIPGLSEESIIPKQVKESGLSLEDFFNNWINTTLNK